MFTKEDGTTNKNYNREEFEIKKNAKIHSIL